MTQKAINYGIVLYQLGISQDMVEEIKALVDENLELADALASPVVEHAEKRKVIDRVFDRFGSKELVNFMKTLCDNDGFDMINDIFDEYEKYAREQQDILSATLYYVTPPTDKQKAGIEDFLMKEYGSKAVQLSMVLNAVVSQQLIPTVDGGVAPAFEIMTVTPAIRNMIRDNKIPQIDGILYSSAKPDMISMDNSLLALYKSGKISKEIALTYATNPDMLMRKL